MNFLGHLYFSNNDVQLMYANLFGDFVRGKDLSNYSEFVEKGILLHREIDSYIDHHPIVIELLHNLYPKLPKVSGIAVDLYFDHLLSRKWESYHQTPYNQFLQLFYDAEPKHILEYTPEYITFLSLLKNKNWMHYYPTLEGLTHACNGLSKRISFENSLHKAPLVFVENEKIIDNAFNLFMKEAIIHFNDYNSKNIT